MPFVEAVHKRLAEISAESEEAILLNFMVHHAVGRANAKTWATIEAYLLRKGVSMRQQRFQQGILKRTRGGKIFIASNDHKPARGYFLINDQTDAEIMRDWYLKRIAREKTNLGHLVELASDLKWAL